MSYTLHGGVLSDSIQEFIQNSKILAITSFMSAFWNVSHV